MSVLPFDRTPCGRCPVADLCMSYQDAWTKEQKDAWSAAVDMDSRPCNEVDV
jgi:hypothetical protein